MGAVQVPALSLPTLAAHTHSDDLGIELGWQAGHAGLGAEEAVEGLHGTRCHQLQRTRCQERGLCFEPTTPEQALPWKTQHCCNCAPSAQPPSSTAVRPASCPGLFSICSLHFQAPSWQPRESDPFQSVAHGERVCPGHPWRGNTHHMAEGHDSEQGLTAGFHHSCRKAGQHIPQQGKDVQGGGGLLGTYRSRATSEPVAHHGKAPVTAVGLIYRTRVNTALTSGNRKATEWPRRLQNTIGAPKVSPTSPAIQCAATSPLPSKSLFSHSGRAPQSQLQTPCSSAPHLQLFQSPAHRTWRWKVLQGGAQGLHRRT